MQSAYLVRIIETQVVRDEAEVLIKAATPESAMRIVLNAGTGNGQYCLSDGRRFTLDPENMVVDGRTYTEIIKDGEVIASSLETVRLGIDPDERAALRVLLEEAICDTSVQGKADIFEAILVKLKQHAEVSRQENWDWD